MTPLGDRQARVAAAVVACSSAGTQLAASAADAWFLDSIGPRYLGAAIAASSLLVAVTLAVVGAAADRRDRRRTLIALTALGAVLLPALDLAHRMGASAAAVAAMILVKQLQAAVDLGFWVVVAERFDARSARRLVPWLAAAGGIGATAGAALVVPIAWVGGASGALLCGAAAMAVAALLVSRLAAARRFGPAPAPGRGPGLGGGLEQVRRQPLARGLAVVVALGGGFASLAYFVLGAAAAGRYGDAAALAQFLGAVRAVAQAIMLTAQVLIAPRLLARAGVGSALVVAPVAAALAALLVAITGGLGAAALVQVQARVLDGSVQAPAEKLVQNLLPVEVRGRVAGFLDGVAKRAGAVVGGLVAMTLVAYPDALAAVLVAVALAWAAASTVVRGRLPGWALAALVGPDGGRSGSAPDDDDVVMGGRADRRVLAQLDELDPVRAAELAARLHQTGGVDARPVIARLLARCDGEAQEVAVASALWACARVHTPGSAMATASGRDRISAARAVAGAVDAVGDRAAVWVARAAGVLGRGAPVELTGERDGAAGAALAVAQARVTADPTVIDVAIETALDDDDPAIAAVGLRELAVEVTHLAATPGPRGHELALRLLRLTRRGRVGTDEDRAAAVTALGTYATASAGHDDAAAILGRTEAYDVIRRLADRRTEPAPAPVAAAALTRLAAWSDPVPADDVHLLADALGDRDDDVRDAAADGLRRLGPSAAPDLARAAGFGRRAARDRALALLHELPVTTSTLDRLVASELDALDRNAIQAAALAGLGGAWLGRRLHERLDEIGHTALLLIAARERAPDIARGAQLLRHAHGAEERSRALEALDAALPRAVAVRLLPALDPGDLPARARDALARRREPAPTRDQAVRAELRGGDPLTRHLVVRALGDERARYRAAIADAARAAAAEVSPLELLRRITAPDDDGDEVPAAVEIMMLLAELPLLAGLTTPQIAALAERAQVVDLDADEVLLGAGERLDALVVVADGELSVGERRVGPGDALDELAPMAPRPVPASVVAAAPARVVRVARLDFEELVDDEPGLAALLLRQLGERLRG